MPTESAPPAEWMLEAAKELGRQRRHITGYQPVEEVARVIARFAPAPEEREPDSSSVMQDDMAELLRVLGLGDHARPCSPHEVMVSEIIPAVRQLVRLPKAPAPASPTVADHPFQECWGEPHRPEWGPIDGCHSQVAFPCGQPRSAHPAAAPEPQSITEKYGYPSPMAWQAANYVAAPAPSVQPADCVCHSGSACGEACNQGYHHDGCSRALPGDYTTPQPAPEPAAQDRLGEIADRIVNNKCCRDDHDWFGQGCHICARAELERVVRETVNVLDHDSDNRWDWTGAERARADEYTRAMLDRWGLS